MKRKKTKKILIWSVASLVFISAVCALVYFTKLYPAATVNGRCITDKKYEDSFAVAYNYSKKILEAQRGDLEIINTAEFQKRTKQTVLDTLIEQDLINAYLKTTMKRSELKEIIDGKINDALAGNDIKKGVEDLYGISMEDFRESILVPQAKREIIEGKFFIENKNFEDWLKEQKTKARVSIFVSGVRWNNGKAEMQ